MSDEETMEFYKSGKYRASTELQDKDSELAHIQHEQRAEYLVELMGKSVFGSHLDIGCSSGELLRAVKTKYPDIYQMGVEIDPVLSTDEFEIVPDIDMIDREFDLITIIHTLEHLNDPNRMMYMIWERLKMGGLLMLEVPNRRASMIAYAPPQHVVAYDADSLMTLFHDFKVMMVLPHGKPFESVLDLNLLVLATK
jgi:2-polyprenyl-3-methyl-5-hydroxy-6-metoxy-1,4-benzoquinol methylase